MNEAFDDGVRESSANAIMIPPRRPNFDRKVVPILGLPFDAISLTEAVEQIRSAAFSGRRCFISTPNLHFAIAARSDVEFRDTVLSSDLNFVDGMPLVWIARLLGLPVTERVAGSDVFDALQAHLGSPINVYLFGGPAGAAQQASESINRRGGGLRCVGFDAAGFGSVESMSTDKLIRRINASGAHFVVASLGAKKGQAWLQLNAPYLTAPVLSHLGAVVNFAAGSVRRAPPWLRSLGLEWVWRIREEPELWRRYRNDGISLLDLMLGRVLPDRFATQKRAAKTANKPPACDLQFSSKGAGLRLCLGGNWEDEHCSPLRQALADVAKKPLASPLTVDLAGVDHVGGTFVGLCLIARGWFGARCRFVGASMTVETTFRHKLAEYLLLDER